MCVSLVETARASSLTQYFSLTFNQVFPWSFDNKVGTTEAGVALDREKERRRDMRNESVIWWRSARQSVRHDLDQCWEVLGE